MNAKCTITDGKAVVSYTFYDGITVKPRVIDSPFPRWLRASGLTLSAGTVRLSSIVKAADVEHLARYLAHEIGHCWQIVRWALGPWHRIWGRVNFWLMYLPRLIFFGCTRKSRNDIETATYSFEDTHWHEFLDVAAQLRAAGLF